MLELDCDASLDSETPPYSIRRLRRDERKRPTGAGRYRRFTVRPDQETIDLCAQSVALIAEALEKTGFTIAQVCDALMAVAIPCRCVLGHR
jgi:hypothetical protein